MRRCAAIELLAATGSGASQAIANLEKLVERARAFAGAGGGGLGPFLAWAAQAGDAAGEQESQVDDEGDVVHLLTIHKAKGLEFPIVVVVGGSRGGRAGGGEPIVDRDGRRVAIRLRAALPGSAAQTLEPASYTVLAEREKRMSESELRRLLYVATTRARDHLVVSCFGKPTTKDGTPASGALLGPIAASLPAPAALEDEYDDGGVLVLPPPQSPPPATEEGDSDPQALLAERASVGRAAPGTPRACRTPRAGHQPERTRARGRGGPDGRSRRSGRPSRGAGAGLGRPPRHGALRPRRRGVSLASPPRPPPSSSAAPIWPPRRPGSPLACWRSAPVRAAARAAAADPGAVHRELAVGALVEGVVLGGAIDLLYRDDDERWVVVDYKTDKAAEPEVLLERYRPQGAAYAVAVEAVLGVGAVKDVCFVPARARGEAVHVPVDDDLRALARAEIVAAAGAGRALAPDELAAES